MNILKEKMQTKHITNMFTEIKTAPIVCNKLFRNAISQFQNMHAILTRAFYIVASVSLYRALVELSNFKLLKQNVN